MLNDPLANALSVINHSENAGRRACTITPTSKIIKKILDILRDNKYLGESKISDSNRGGYMNVQLLGNINKCGVIKPRFAIKKDEFNKFEKRFLPAKDFGILIISTPKGIMTHTEAKENNYGGRLLAFCY